MVFVVLALLALLVVAGSTYLLGGKIARDNALHDAEEVTARMARYLVAPFRAGVSDSQDKGQYKSLNQLLRFRIRDRSVTAVFVWAADGTLRYANRPELQDAPAPVSPELRQALAGEVVSDFEEHSEIDDPALQGPRLEVYAPVPGEGEPLAFEAYFDTEMIADDAAAIRSRIVPLAVGALLLLELIQIPIVASLTRRLSRHEAERTELVRRHLEASEAERREIAADVHDGPVQDLAGVSYALSALRPSVPDAQKPMVDRLVLATRSAVASLRRLMVDIYPPDLSGAGLPAALEDLAGPLRDRDVTVTVEHNGVPDVPPQVAAALYRTAKEALVNIAKHAEATSVSISVDETTCDDGSPAVRLCIMDDGVGFPEHVLQNGARQPQGGSTANGHMGLRLAHDRINELGGVLEMANQNGAGAVVTVVVPLSLPG